MLQQAGYQTAAATGDRVESLKAEWNSAVDSLRKVTDPARPSQANVIGIVNDAGGPRDVVVCAAGSMPGDLMKLWRPLDAKSYHVEYGFSCMGYEIAGGLGVKMADPEREVFVMVGDGSYLLMSSEIVTAIQEGVKLIIVVVDNHGYQSIHGLQRASGSPSFGNELRFRNPETGLLDGEPVPIDFAANAASLGAVALSARTADELRTALAQAKRETTTTVIQVRLDNEARVPSFESWWDVPIAEVSGDPDVRAARAEYVSDRANERYFTASETE
ncbi:MAG: thiamine pyrophosphate-dependent enzyme, partial [Chloroflexota bacterium]|nr:thiamine pyrophosphate-dependent enzyme [Chloroflexota bacterium]